MSLSFHVVKEVSGNIVILFELPISKGLYLQFYLPLQFVPFDELRLTFLACFLLLPLPEVTS